MPLKILLIAFSILIGTNAGAIEKQEGMNWCWAASVQSVVLQAGYYEPQRIVAARLTGTPPQDRPASIQEVINLLNIYGLKAWRAGRPGTPQELSTTLRSGWKLIALAAPNNGPVGHFIVLEGIDMYGNVVISDPATGMTTPTNLAVLYNGWRWQDSIVVGR